MESLIVTCPIVEFVKLSILLIITRLSDYFQFVGNGRTYLSQILWVLIHELRKILIFCHVIIIYKNYINKLWIVNKNN